MPFGELRCVVKSGYKILFYIYRVIFVSHLRVKDTQICKPVCLLSRRQKFTSDHQKYNHYILHHLLIHIVRFFSSSHYIQHNDTLSNSIKNI